jgi:hypothetical protein
VKRFSEEQLTFKLEGIALKKFLVVILIFVILGFAVPSASGQRRYRRHRHGRSFWQKHRDKLTVAGTTGGGAAIGAIAGGKKGALIGGAVGAGSGALYTYKIRKRHRHRRY